MYSHVRRFARACVHTHTIVSTHRHHRMHSHPSSNHVHPPAEMRYILYIYIYIHYIFLCIYTHIHEGVEICMPTYVNNNWMQYMYVSAYIKWCWHIHIRACTHRHTHRQGRMVEVHSILKLLYSSSVNVCMQKPWWMCTIYTFHFIMHTFTCMFM